VEATVVDKREVPASGEPTDASVEAETAKQLMTFEFEGRQKELLVPASIYSITRVGQKGTLRLRAEQFEDFEPKTEGEDADDVYRRVVRS